jgi:hypothetical protein
VRVEDMLLQVLRVMSVAARWTREVRVDVRADVRAVCCAL